MPEYLTHKVVNIDKVKVKLRKDISEYEKTYEAQAKYDGCFAFIRLDPEKGMVFSRTGEDVPSMRQQGDAMAQFFINEVEFHNGLVLLGEAWSPSLGQNEISGLFRQHAPAPELKVIVFDCLTQEEYNAGHSPVGYAERMGRLAGKLPTWVRGINSSPPNVWRAQRWTPGTYDALHLTSQLVDDPEGYDGLILADPEGTWTAGRGTTGEKVRLKKTLSFDLRVTGVHEGVGEKTGRAVYTLTVDYKGKSLGVGSGLPHDFDRVPKVGDIVEIHAMDFSSDGLLREPRYKGIRFDKEQAD